MQSQTSALTTLWSPLPMQSLLLVLWSWQSVFWFRPTASTLGVRNAQQFIRGGRLRRRSIPALASMKTYEGLDAQGHAAYFEVPNAMLSRRAACKIVSRVPGVSVTTWPNVWPFGSNDVFCKFELDGKQFELWEPYGDNGRFHVAANPLEPCDALQHLRSAFQEHHSVSGITRWLILVAGLVLVCYRLFSH
jgi:hypothetical protein